VAPHPFLLLEAFALPPGGGNLLPVILDADEVTVGDRSDMDVDTSDGIVVSGPVLVRATGTVEP